MTKNLVTGIDIGSYSVKIIEVFRKGKAVELHACSSKIIPKDLSVEEKINLLKDFYKSAGALNKEVNISVSGENTIARYALFPLMPKSTLIYSLKFEFEQYIPFSLDESVVDVDILQKRTNKQMDVIIVAAKKNYVEEKENFIKKLGLIPKSINIDGLAILKAFVESQYFSSQKSFVLLNVGNSITTIVILNKGIPIFLRDIKMGGEKLTRFISEKMNISLIEAEELKCNPDKNTPLLNILSTDLNLLINEVSLCLEYAKKTYNLDEIEAIYLSGGSSKLLGLTGLLQENLKIKVSLWNPFVGMKNLEKFSFLEKLYPDFILCLGLTVL